MKNILSHSIIFGASLMGGAVFAAPIGFSGNIEADATLNVPEDFATIQGALAYLDNKRINSNATVSIQVNCATANLYGYDTIEVSHPDGGRIHILGDVENPANCTITFGDDITGVSVQKGRELGLIDGFVLQGRYVSVFNLGIIALSHGFIEGGGSLKVTGFRYGVEARNGGHVELQPGFEAYGNSLGGVLARFNGSVNANYTICRNNGLDGYVAASGGMMMAAYSISQDNGGYGYHSWINAHISAQSTSSSCSGNSTGCYSVSGSGVETSAGETILYD